jgi:hypothetical protein
MDVESGRVRVAGRGIRKVLSWVGLKLPVSIPLAFRFRRAFSWGALHLLVLFFVGLSVLLTFAIFKHDLGAGSGLCDLIWTVYCMEHKHINGAG